MKSCPGAHIIGTNAHAITVTQPLQPDTIRTQSRTCLNQPAQQCGNIPPQAGFQSWRTGLGKRPQSDKNGPTTRLRSVGDQGQIRGRPKGIPSMIRRRSGGPQPQSVTRLSPKKAPTCNPSGRDPGQIKGRPFEDQAGISLKA